MKLLLFFTLLLLVSCSVEPQPIDYQHDQCAYCKMIIADTRFGAEMVTDKGKVYKYDAAECLINDYLDHPQTDYAFILVTDFLQPKTLIDANKASYLVSQARPSPMGAHLSAYTSRNAASKAQQELGGELYSFDELLKKHGADH